MNKKNTPGTFLVVGAAMLIGLNGCGEQPPQQESAADAADIEPTPMEDTADMDASPRVNTGAEISNEPLVAKAGSMVYALDVSGMTCSGCANTINDAVNSIEGVQAVRVSLVNHAVWVQVDETKATPVDEITSAIGEAGYTASVAGSGSDEGAAESNSETEDG